MTSTFSQVAVALPDRLGPLPVENRDAFDLLAQVTVEIADERLQHLPLVVLHLAVNLGNEQVPGGVVPLNPAGVLDVLPATLAHAVEGRVRPPEASLRGLQQGFQFRLDAHFGNNLHDLHGCYSS